MWLRSEISREIEKFAAVGDFLRSLGTVSPDVIKWIETLPNPSKYVNIIQKNPRITLNELKEYQFKAADPDASKKWLASKGVKEPFIDYCIDNDRIPRKIQKWMAIELEKMYRKEEDGWIDHMSKIPTPTGIFDLGKPETIKFIHDQYIESKKPEIIEICDMASWRIKHNEPFIRGKDITRYTFEEAFNETHAWQEEMKERRGEGHPEFYKHPNGVNPWDRKDLGDGYYMVEVHVDDLENEGAIMQHCVGDGDYGEEVKKGKTVIYSLRDPHGWPHATIEVTNRDYVSEEEEEEARSEYEAEHRREWENDPENQIRDEKGNIIGYEDYYGPDDYDGYEGPWTGQEDWWIEQIQGKQNNSPIDRYRPYLRKWVDSHDYQVSEDILISITSEDEIMEWILEDKKGSSLSNYFEHISPENAIKIFKMVQANPREWGESAILKFIADTSNKAYDRTSEKSFFMLKEFLSHDFTYAVRGGAAQHMYIPGIKLVNRDPEVREWVKTTIANELGFIGSSTKVCHHLLDMLSETVFNPLDKKKSGPVIRQLSKDAIPLAIDTANYFASVREHTPKSRDFWDFLVGHLVKEVDPQTGAKIVTNSFKASGPISTYNLRMHLGHLPPEQFWKIWITLDKDVRKRIRDEDYKSKYREVDLLKPHAPLIEQMDEYDRQVQQYERQQADIADSASRGFKLHPEVIHEMPKSYPKYDPQWVSEEQWTEHQRVSVPQENVNVAWSYVFMDKMAAVGDYLRDLEGVSPEVIQWVEGLDDPSHYVNYIKQNPGISLEQVQQYQPPVKEKVDPYTEDERNISRLYASGNFRSWVLVQLRKLRAFLFNEERGFPRRYEGAPISITNIHNQDFEVYADNKMFYENPKEGGICDIEHLHTYIFDPLNDWALATQPDIASYTVEQALAAEEAWNRANRSGKTEYDGSQQNLYSPSEWSGWHVVRLMSDHDADVEGNLMSHCVGDCGIDDVETGEEGVFYDQYSHRFVRLYSLRDPEGQPHVTMEVDTGIDAGGKPIAEGYDEEWVGYKNEITQIYGVKNSKPKPEYMKMMKEFIQNNFRGEDELMVPVDLTQVRSMHLPDRETDEWPAILEDFVYGKDSRTGAQKFIGGITLDVNIISNVYGEIIRSLQVVEENFGDLPIDHLDQIAYLLTKIAVDIEKSIGSSPEKVRDSVMRQHSSPHYYMVTAVGDLLNQVRQDWYRDKSRGGGNITKTRAARELDRHLEEEISQFMSGHKHRSWSYVFPRKFGEGDSKPMALPFADPERPWSGGLERIDKEMLPGVANEVRQLYPNIEFFAAGTNGMVADLGNGNIGKFTIYRYEAETARRLMENPSEYTVKVFNVLDLGAVANLHEDLHEEEHRLYMIEMEFVDPLYIPVGSSISRPEKLFPEEMRALHEELLEHNLPVHDVWEPNVGRNEKGDLVLLDLGSSDVRIKEGSDISREKTKYSLKFADGKPMALPFADPPANFYLGHPGHRGLSKVDEWMTEDVAREQEKEFSPEFLGAGNLGVVVQLPDGKIGKYTADANEAFISRWAIRNRLACLPIIYDVRELQEDPQLWVVIREEVTPLNREELIAVRDIAYTLNDEDLESARRKVMVDPRYSYGLEGELATKFLDTFECLYNNGIGTQDFYGRNVGYTSDGRLVLFDLGLSWDLAWFKESSRWLYTFPRKFGQEQVSSWRKILEMLRRGDNEAAERYLMGQGYSPREIRNLLDMARRQLETPMVEPFRRSLEYGGKWRYKYAELRHDSVFFLIDGRLEFFNDLHGNYLARRFGMTRSEGNALRFLLPRGRALKSGMMTYVEGSSELAPYRGVLMHELRLEPMDRPLWYLGDPGGPMRDHFNTDRNIAIDILRNTINDQGYLSRAAIAFLDKYAPDLMEEFGYVTQAGVSSNSREKIAASIEYSFVGESDYEVAGQAYDLARRSEISILSDKEPVLVAVGHSKVVGALFTSLMSNSYSFDVVVDPEYQGRGIGRELIDAGISEYSNLKAEMPEITMDLDVVNPTLQEAFRRRGLEEKKRVSDDRVIMGSSSREKTTFFQKTNARKQKIADTETAWTYRFGRGQWDFLGDKMRAYRAIDLSRVEQALTNGFPADQFFTPDIDRAIFYSNFNSDEVPGAIFDCYLDTSRSWADMNDATNEEADEAYQAVRSALYEIQRDLQAANIQIMDHDLESFIGQQVGADIGGYYEGQNLASLWLFIAEEAGITPHEAREIVSPGFYGGFITLDDRGVFGIDADIPSGQMSYSAAVPPQNIISIHLHSSLIEPLGWNLPIDFGNNVSVIPAQLDELKQSVVDQLAAMDYDMYDSELYDYLKRLDEEFEEEMGHYEDERGKVNIPGNIYRKLLSGEDITEDDLDVSDGFIRFDMPEGRMKVLYVIRKVLGKGIKPSPREEIMVPA